jgi:hypothetical protein
MASTVKLICTAVLTLLTQVGNAHLSQPLYATRIYITVLTRLRSRRRRSSMLWVLANFMLWAVGHQLLPCLVKRDNIRIRLGVPCDHRPRELARLE